MKPSESKLNFFSRANKYLYITCPSDNNLFHEFQSEIIFGLNPISLKENVLLRMYTYKTIFSIGEQRYLTYIVTVMYIIHA